MEFAISVQLEPAVSWAALRSEVFSPPPVGLRWAFHFLKLVCTSWLGRAWL